MKKLGTLLMLMVLLFSVFVETGAVPGGTDDCCCGMCGAVQDGSHHCCPCMTLVQLDAPTYLPPESVIVPPVIRTTQIFLSLHRIGELSSHYSLDWKPPKGSSTEPNI